MSRRRRLVAVVVVAGAVVALERAALGWAADGRVVSRLLAAGNHTPPGLALAAVAVVALRLAAVVLLPGWLAVQVGRLLWPPPKKTPTDQTE